MSQYAAQIYEEIMSIRGAGGVAACQAPPQQSAAL